VFAIQGGAMLLRPHLPSPAPTEARIETFLTIGCLGAFVFVVLVLASPRLARQFDIPPTATRIALVGELTRRTGQLSRDGESPRR
jgi:hypothetical protein